ncbi:MAG: DUF1624 domain-containing protein [Lachnospiraceae bacterium]|nr:DUF1624 domain-containing protein [Lachnospiraceae bacterium]
MEHKRYALPDIFRGLILLSMLTYHTAWDMVYIFGQEWDWFESYSAYIWQQSICWSFILLSGFCWSFGRKKWKRGIMVFGAGALISLVTFVFMPENRVLFGVLTLLGSSMLFMIPLEKVMRKVNPYVGLLGALFLFMYTKNISYGTIGWKDFGYVRLPKEWYANLFTAYWGLPTGGFYSTDYFGIFPWLFLFVAGYFLCRIFEKNQWMGVLKRGEIVPLQVLGKNSLLIYMVHQPLIYGVLMVVYGVMG